MALTVKCNYQLTPQAPSTSIHVPAAAPVTERAALRRLCSCAASASPGPDARAPLGPWAPRAGSEPSGHASCPAHSCPQAPRSQGRPGATLAPQQTWRGPHLTTAHRTLEGPGPWPPPVPEGLASSWETAGTAGGELTRGKPHQQCRQPPCPERPGQLPRLGKQGRGEGRPTPGTGGTPSGPGCWAGHRSSLPDQGSSLRLPRWQAGSSPLSHQGSLVTYSSVWIQALLGGWRVTAWLHLRFSEEPPERWPQRLHQLMLLPTGQEGPLSPHPPRCALPVGFLMGGFCPA